MAKKLANENKPWIENYPPLKSWLDQHGHSCLWQTELHGDRMVECWLVGVSLTPIVITIQPHRRGWDVYTSAPTNKIDETLVDLEQRVGLRKVPTLAEAFAAGVTASRGETLSDDERDVAFGNWHEAAIGNLKS